jgi:hypothetical protein
MLGRLHLAILASCAVVAACSSSPAMSPTPGATATPAPTAAATAASTATAPATSPAPTPAASSGAFPSAAEDLLISYADPALQATCARSDPIYPTEIDSITCGPEDLPFTYSLFSKLDDVKAAYDRDLARGETPPAPNGTCAQANQEGRYTIGDQPAGRRNCRSHHSASTGDPFNVIEWTNEQLLVIGYFSNRADLHTWAELITFWQEQAGPFPAS